MPDHRANHEAGGLTVPVNVIYVDRRGEAALIVLRPANGDPVGQ